MILQLADETGQLRHDALVKNNPLLDFDELLFVRRSTYQSTHYYTDYIDGCERFGGNLCVLSLGDGRRVVFGHKARQEVGFRVWEAGVDGKGLRQITFDPPDEQQRIAKYRHRGLEQWAGRPLVYNHHTDDMHPCYLPDGGICFVSTRCEQ